MEQSKAELLATLRPRAVLKALTREALQAVPLAALVDDMIAIRAFPFRIGRESRIDMIDGRWHRKERPRQFDGTDHAPNNDLYLFDWGVGLQISREHLQIERLAHGGYGILDRGSACGTVVGGRLIGGLDEGGATHLEDGEVIILGEHDASPFRYRFFAFD